VLLHDDELTAFTSQVKALGPETTLLVDTYDIRRGVELAVQAAGPALGAIRIDSGDLGVLARQARDQLDALGARDTRIVLSGDLDEYAIAALRAEPVDSYGVGTSVVTGSGAPTAGMVYKLVEVDGRPVAKRSASKESRGGAKSAVRRYKPTGTALEEVVHPVGHPVEVGPHDRVLPVPLLRGGEPVAGLPTLEESREHLRAALVSVPWEGLKLSRGEPALTTVFEGI
jgi:nicotinate phosphoribosyltransferase